MNEIKCPKCGEVFKVDESGYAAIVKEIRDEEFKKEQKKQLELQQSEQAAAQEKAQGAKLILIIGCGIAAVGAVLVTVLVVLLAKQRRNCKYCL